MRFPAAKRHRTHIEKHGIVDWEEIIGCDVFGFFHVLQLQVEHIELQIELLFKRNPFLE